MSLALARKWRPKNFSDLIGQSIVVKTLSNAIKKNRLHHAYLFTGTRGVGKTTIARIFAMCLSCEKGVSIDPCQTCTNCKSIALGQHIDIIEIDAASKTKVEDTRELLLNVNYAPQKTKFKIFIIDEVHMLSTHSFNALLKTLEEPPAHVKFLLATTDPQKIPATILSRCLQFHLQTISQKEINHHLCNILNKEKVLFESEAIEIISQAANGSVRDSLSLLDQAIAIEEKITKGSIQEMLGYIETTIIRALLEAILNKSATQTLSQIDKLIQNGQPPSQILTQLLEMIHKLIIHVNDKSHPSPVNMDNIKNNTNTTITHEWLHLLYQIGIAGLRDIDFSPTQRHGLEISLLRMSSLTPPCNDNKTPPWWDQQAINQEQKNNNLTKNSKPVTQSKIVENIEINANTWLNIKNKLESNSNLQKLLQEITFNKYENNTIYLEAKNLIKTSIQDSKLLEAELQKQNINCKITILQTTQQHTDEQIATLLNTFDGKIIE